LGASVIVLSTPVRNAEPLPRRTARRRDGDPLSANVTSTGLEDVFVTNTSSESEGMGRNHSDAEPLLRESVMVQRSRVVPSMTVA
jgi:hypothetical protein